MFVARLLATEITDKDAAALGLDCGFGNAVPAAGRKGLRRTGSATLCAGHCTRTTPQKPTSPRRCRRGWRGNTSVARPPGRVRWVRGHRRSCWGTRRADRRLRRCTPDLRQILSTPPANQKRHVVGRAANHFREMLRTQVFLSYGSAVAQVLGP